jgi:hypothetical protein
LSLAAPSLERRSENRIATTPTSRYDGMLS